MTVSAKKGKLDRLKTLLRNRLGSWWLKRSVSCPSQNFIFSRLIAPARQMANQTPKAQPKKIPLKAPPRIPLNNIQRTPFSHRIYKARDAFVERIQSSSSPLTGSLRSRYWSANTTNIVSDIRLLLSIWIMDDRLHWVKIPPDGRAIEES